MESQADDEQVIEYQYTLDLGVIYFLIFVSSIMTIAFVCQREFVVACQFLAGMSLICLCILLWLKKRGLEWVKLGADTVSHGFGADTLETLPLVGLKMSTHYSRNDPGSYVLKSGFNYFYIQTRLPGVQDLLERIAQKTGEEVPVIVRKLRVYVR